MQYIHRFSIFWQLLKVSPLLLLYEMFFCIFAYQKIQQISFQNYMNKKHW